MNKNATLGFLIFVSKTEVDLFQYFITNFKGKLARALRTKSTNQQMRTSATFLFQTLRRKKTR